MTRLPPPSGLSRWSTEKPPPTHPVGQPRFNGTPRELPPKRKHSRTFSLPGETNDRLEAFLSQGHVNLSEWVRGLIEADLLRRGFGPQKK